MAVAKLRKLVVLGATWQFRIGRSDAILYDPNGRKYVIGLSFITVRSNDTIARGRWKRTSDGTVTPGQVAEYIELRLV